MGRKKTRVQPNRTINALVTHIFGTILTPLFPLHPPLHHQVKDTRNTELMVQVQQAEQMVKDAEKRVAVAEEGAKLARQEATEIAATFGAGSGGGESLKYTTVLCVKIMFMFLEYGAFI